ncbi:MAG TPA: LacI family DNA-binding transcriptional regulator [Candidatus Limnocylindrales bacterium]|nr:LacI family DNA-binding transcriptional regulator [Candidatus Limnocylindrales bacterium]
MGDLAREAGVSQSTVSRVLNGAPSSIQISQATRERVLDAARRLGYRPNPLARGLRGARTMLLGVIVREITDPFFTGAVEAISTEAAKHGYNVVLGHAHGRADEAIVLRSVLETRHVDAILLLGDMRDQPRLIEDLQGSREPVVALWQGRALHGLPMVNVDNAAGISQALDHLLALGHRRIAFVSGRPLGDIQERLAAYEARMRAEGLAVPDGYVQHVANEPAGGAEALDALLRLPVPPTAVVCSTDQLAIGVLHQADARGIRVPERLSVTGFDDLPVSAYTVPALTTVRMPLAEMAARAGEIAIERAVGGRSPAGAPAEILQPVLVVRDSTAPPEGVPGRRPGRRARGAGATITSRGMER